MRRLRQIIKLIRFLLSLFCNKGLRPPLNLTIEVRKMALNREVTISWEHNPANQDVTSYGVKLFVDGSLYHEVSTGAEATSAVINYPQGKDVEFKAEVKAYDGDGNSAAAEATKLVPDPSPVSPPINVTIDVV